MFFKAEAKWLAVYGGASLGAFALATSMGVAKGVDTIKIASVYAHQSFVLGTLVILISGTLFLIGCAIMREARPVALLTQLITARLTWPGFLVAVLAVLLFTPMLMASFGTLKILMPLSRDFTWDDTLASIDRMIFQGIQPWELTHALLGSPSATILLDIVYTLWVPTLALSVLLAGVAPRLHRARFFLCFGAGWLLLGVLGAYVFASAGPCYAPLLGTATAHEYEGLLERLQTISGSHTLGAVTWQKILWNAHIERDYQFAMGISAMPSMHNYVSVLYALMAWNSKPILRHGSKLFAIMVFIGSIHLGWHYAIDGIASTIAAVAIWGIVNAYLRFSGYLADVTRASVARPSNERDTLAPVLG